MNAQPRKVTKVVTPQTVLEGAGVRLKRSMPSSVLDYVDPFLLFDHFGSSNPDDYILGFPMHPHRGIETVTYMLEGVVNHRDSLGNAGSIEAGDVQWMTSGRGIMHEEMPQPRDGNMAGFQLWVNLPAKLKMTTPRYQEILSGRIPEIRREDGVKLRVIAGTVDNVSGPVTEIAAQPTYLDVSLPAHASFSHPIERGHAALPMCSKARERSPGLCLQSQQSRMASQTQGREKLALTPGSSCLMMEILSKWSQPVNPSGFCSFRASRCTKRLPATGRL